MESDHFKGCNKSCEEKAEIKKQLISIDVKAKEEFHY